MGRVEALRDHYVTQLDAFGVALDRLLEQPGPYFNPAILPDPAKDEDFCERYSELRRAITSLAAPGALPKRRYHVAYGAGLPIGGCLRRVAMESMRKDVSACIGAIAALRRPGGARSRR